MFDWSNIINIAFVAGIGGLSLFFLVSTIAVAAKGKRKCNAFDVILRILSTLCFIAALVLILCAVLTMLSGDLRIKFEPSPVVGDPLVPTLAFFGKDIVLPLAELFLIFSTEIGVVIGFACAGALFVLSLMTLIVDCLVANQKVKKDKKSGTQKTAVKSAEQIKREKELERIKRIGESAVQKTAKAAQAEKTENSAAPQTEQQPEEDWRSAPVEQNKKDNDTPAEFVGITENTENEFDTFDDVMDGNSDSDSEAVASEPEEPAIPTETEQLAEEYSEPEEDSAPQAEPFVAEDTAEPISDEEEPLSQADEQVEEEEATDEVIEEAPVADFAATVEPSTENEVFEDVPTAEPVAEAAEEVTEAAEEVAADADERTDPTEDVTESAKEERPSDAESSDDYADIEPDRDIYIPEIRTIVKSGEDEEQEKPTPVKKTASSAKKPASRRSGGTKSTTARGTNAKNAEKPSESGAKKPTKRNSSPRGGAAATRTAQRQEEPTAEKKLPVTRRYVILDRRNAVNMFGEYLRERNKADKEKLQSSINTIIIE